MGAECRPGLDPRSNQSDMAGGLNGATIGMVDTDRSLGRTVGQSKG